MGGPSGLSALRGGAGLPGGAAAGAGGGGVNPAGVGAAGVRGMGPMGMMGGAGGHGRGGKDEDDDDHATPQILINYDNTDEFMGDMPAASPGLSVTGPSRRKPKRPRGNEKCAATKPLAGT